MATTLNVSLPSIREPFLSDNGQISRPWWLFLNALAKFIGSGQVPDLTAIINQLNAQAGSIADLETNVGSLSPSDAAIGMLLMRVVDLEIQLGSLAFQPIGKNDREVADLQILVNS